MIAEVKHVFFSINMFLCFADVFQYDAVIFETVSENERFVVKNICKENQESRKRPLYVSV